VKQQINGPMSFWNRGSAAFAAAAAAAAAAAVNEFEKTANNPDNNNKPDHNKPDNPDNQKRGYCTLSLLSGSSSSSRNESETCAFFGGQNTMKQHIEGSMSFWNRFCCFCCCCCTKRMRENRRQQQPGQQQQTGQQQPGPGQQPKMCYCTLSLWNVETLKVKVKRVRCLGGRNAMKQQINGSMSFWNMGFAAAAAAAVVANESDKTTITNPDNNPDNNSDNQKR